MWHKIKQYQKGKNSPSNTTVRHPLECVLAQSVREKHSSHLSSSLQSQSQRKRGFDFLLQTVHLKPPSSCVPGIVCAILLHFSSIPEAGSRTSPCTWLCFSPKVPPIFPLLSACRIPYTRPNDQDFRDSIRSLPTDLERQSYRREGKKRLPVPNKSHRSGQRAAGQSLI